jgi:hypothetical protein
MINENLNVENCEANGTMCLFEGIVLKPEITFDDLGTIIIDEYYVRCAHVSQIQSIKLRIMDGLSIPYEPQYTFKSLTARAHFPLPLYPHIDKSAMRIWRGLKMVQFPIVCANARTVHKLQGRTLDNTVTNSWKYTGNWIYVALSRVRVRVRIPTDKRVGA